MGWAVLAVLGGAFLFVLVAHPIGTGSVVVAFAAVTTLLERRRTRYVRAEAEKRAGEDIGSFARAFERRGPNPADPWAIRAVWQALTPRTEAKGRQLPLRPTDHFDTDLCIDSEDIEALVPALVAQCERDPGNWEANPYLNRVRTVADLVHFISAQPLRRSA